MKRRYIDAVAMLREMGHLAGPVVMGEKIISVRVSCSPIIIPYVIEELGPLFPEFRLDKFTNYDSYILLTT